VFLSFWYDLDRRHVFEAEVELLRIYEKTRTRPSLLIRPGDRNTAHLVKHPIRLHTYKQREERGRGEGREEESKIERLNE
jgi:hypothetical protein